ncbi:MAG: helix-turn-helix domain-containing protein [Bacillota bacterium]
MDESSHQPSLDGLGYAVSHNTSSHWNMDRYHFHEFYEVNYILSDGVSWFVSDQVYQVQAGTLMILSDGDLHRSVSATGSKYERYVLHLSPAFVQELSTATTNLADCFVNRKQHATRCLQLQPGQQSRLLALLDKAARYRHQRTFGADLYRRLAVTELLLLVNQLFRGATRPRQARLDSRLGPLTPILGYIQSHLGESLSLDQLGSEFYLNKYHLGRLFKQATGFTVNEYIIHCRILRARELLRQDLSIQQVGVQVGFPNASHFIRTFKQLVGTTPKQYQLRARAIGAPKE